MAGFVQIVEFKTSRIDEVGGSWRRRVLAAVSCRWPGGELEQAGDHRDGRANDVAL